MGFSYEDDFAQFPAEYQDAIRTLFDTPIPQHLRNIPNVTVVYEVFRRLSYPLRDWSSWLELLDQEKKVDLGLIVALQKSYMDVVGAQIAELKGGGAPQKVQNEILSAFFKFFIESRLFDYFSDWHIKNFDK